MNGTTSTRRPARARSASRTAPSRRAPAWWSDLEPADTSPQARERLGHPLVERRRALAAAQHEHAGRAARSVRRRREARAKRHADHAACARAEPAPPSSIPRDVRARREGREDPVREADDAVRLEDGHRDAEERRRERDGPGRVASDAEDDARPEAAHERSAPAPSRAPRRAPADGARRLRRPSSARRRAARAASRVRGSTRASSPRGVPQNTTSTSASAASASATARPGKT